MRRIAWGWLVACLSVWSAAAQQPAAPPAGREPSWAFPAINQQLPAEEGAKSVPGSNKSYTPAQIDDLMNPPDWFPEDHAPAPALVQKGHGTALACGACHLMSGEGHPESAGLTGFTAAYLMQQMADFKSGARKDSARMNAIAKDVTDEESAQVAGWFAALKPGPWTKVTEADTVPKTIVGQGRMRFLAPAGGTEPIANRIITVPQDQARARNRDPKSGFIAYVPTGSIAKGKALVDNGGAGKTVACAHLPRRQHARPGECSAARRPSPDLHRAPALSLQGRHAKRRRCAADEEAGRPSDRRRHPRDCGVSGSL